MLGKGYPAPSNTFRWCTDRLKISSANRFIQDQVSEYGEVIMALGSRKDESSTRAQVLNTHHIKGTKLSRHSTLPSAFIYPPLRDFNTEDVWNYLLQNKNPWGANNRDLLSMYQNANASECPLVVDTNTASCGNSRFGCWVCTVVSEDKSMTNMIDNGETWMEPLLELRQDLKDTQDPEIKKKVRDVKHRNGKIIFWKDRLAMGPYTMEFCQNYLNALVKLPSTKLTKKLFIISSDTLVESPKIVETVTDSLEMMENAAKKVGLPVHTNLVRPIIEETFWVCLLGKGYPAPSNTFRWCTDRLKISSANRFIQDQVSEYGEVIMALGSRKDESSTRAQVLNTHHIKGTKLSRHSTLPSAFIYPPLRDFNTEDVWNYLLQNKNPWGANNRDLLSMYQNDNASECPLVVDY